MKILLSVKMSVGRCHEFRECMIAVDQTLSLVHGLADDVFLLDFLDFESFMYLDQGSCGSRIYPKTSSDSEFYF